LNISADSNRKKRPPRNFNMKESGQQKSESNKNKRRFRERNGNEKR